MTSLPGFESFDDADEWINNFEATAKRQAEAATAMAEKLSTIQASGTDDGHLATATVDTNGILKDLNLHPQVRNHSPEATARAVLAAVQRAQQNLTTVAQQALASMGEQDPSLAATMLESYTERFGPASPRQP